MDCMSMELFFCGFIDTLVYKRGSQTVLIKSVKKQFWTEN